MELSISEPTVCISIRDLVGFRCVHYTSLSCMLLFRPWSPYSLQLLLWLGAMFSNLPLHPFLLHPTPSSFTGISRHSSSLPFSPSAYPYLPKPPAPSSHSARGLSCTAHGTLSLSPVSSAPASPMVISLLLDTQLLFHLHVIPSTLKENCLDFTFFMTTSSLFFFTAKFLKELSTQTSHFLTSH